MKVVSIILLLASPCYAQERAANIARYFTTGASIGIDTYNAFHESDKKRALARLGIKDGSIIAISEVTKHFIHKDRPDHSDNKSFFSEHTALSFSCFGKCFYFGFSTGALSLLAKKHDIIDAAVGAGVGIGINKLVNR